MHAAGRDLAGVAAAGVHAGRAPVAAAGVRAQLLRRAARARRAAAQRPPAAAALQLHGVRAEHPAVAQRVPEAARGRRGAGRGGRRGAGGRRARYLLGRAARVGGGRPLSVCVGRRGGQQRGRRVLGEPVHQREPHKRHSDTYFRVGHRENYMHNRCFRRVIV